MRMCSSPARRSTAELGAQRAAAITMCTRCVQASGRPRWVGERSGAHRGAEQRVVAVQQLHVRRVVPAVVAAEAHPEQHEVAEGDRPQRRRAHALQRHPDPLRAGRPPQRRRGEEERLEETLAPLPDDVRVRPLHARLNTCHLSQSQSRTRRKPIQDQTQGLKDVRLTTCAAPVKFCADVMRISSAITQ